MRIVLQRVREAAVEIDGQPVARIGAGALLLVGFGAGDRAESLPAWAAKVTQLRFFADAAGKMNASLLETGGSALVVSQFTLYADCRQGRRPSFTEAAPSSMAEPLYDAFLAALRATGVPVATGVFGADMQVHLVNDGPVTMLLDGDDRIEASSA